MRQLAGTRTRYRRAHAAPLAGLFFDRVKYKSWSAPNSDESGYTSLPLYFKANGDLSNDDFCFNEIRRICVICFLHLLQSFPTNRVIRAFEDWLIPWQVDQTVLTNQQLAVVQ